MNLKQLRNDPNFNFQPRCDKLNITQLGFADDLLLFCRGDTVSVQMMYECFKEFSRASGLKANVAKSSIYFGGVPHEVQLEILQAVGFSKGELPFKYLGIPLSTKRISMSQCQPLVDKILGRITSWTARYLSYAGRLQLIKTVLFSIQIYWSHIFVLPKKLIKKIEAVCRTFLWTGEVETSRKALLAWERVCMPKTAGGYNVLEISTWNKAAICKLLWNLCKKKDKLVLKWQGISRTALDWQKEIEWAEGNAKGRNVDAQLYRVTLA